MCLREISPLWPSREVRSLSAANWAPHVALCQSSITVPRTEKRTHHSHHIGKVSLPCASSCAHPVLSSGWRPCCIRCIYTASPAATHTHTHTAFTDRAWKIIPFIPYGPNLQGEKRVMTHVCAHTWRTNKQARTQRRKTQEDVEVFLWQTLLCSHRNLGSEARTAPAGGRKQPTQGPSKTHGFSKKKGQHWTETAFERVSGRWHSAAVEDQSCVSTPHQFTQEHFLCVFWRDLSKSVQLCDEEAGKQAVGEHLTRR